MFVKAGPDCAAENFSPVFSMISFHKDIAPNLPLQPDSMETAAVCQVLCRRWAEKGKKKIIFSAESISSFKSLHQQKVRLLLSVAALFCSAEGKCLEAWGLQSLAVNSSLTLHGMINDEV